MSPRPPPLIYPRTTLPPSSTMADSLRPLPSTAFPHHHQLPPPIFGSTPGTSQRFSGPGPVLAPLAIPSPGGSTLPQPPAQQPKQATHIPPQHSLSQHASSPLQTPHKLEVRRVSTTSYSGIIPSQPSFNSPAPSGFSSPASYNIERGYDDRKFSFDSEQEQRRYNNCSLVSWRVRGLI